MILVLHAFLKPSECWKFGKSGFKRVSGKGLGGGARPGCRGWRRSPNSVVVVNPDWEGRRYGEVEGKRGVRMNGYRGIGEELRAELRRCVNAAGLQALREALLLAEEARFPGGYELISVIGAEVGIAADLAKAGSEWLGLAGKVGCNGVVFSDDEDVARLDRDLCKALEEGLGMWEESWRGLFDLALCHKQGRDRSRVDGKVFDEFEREIRRGREILKRLEWTVGEWDGSPEDRQKRLTAENVLYFASDEDGEDVVWDVAPDGSRVSRRWAGAVVTAADAMSDDGEDAG